MTCAGSAAVAAPPLCSGHADLTDLHPSLATARSPFSLPGRQYRKTDDSSHSARFFSNPAQVCFSITSNWEKLTYPLFFRQKITVRSLPSLTSSSGFRARCGHLRFPHRDLDVPAAPLARPLLRATDHLNDDLPAHQWATPTLLMNGKRQHPLLDVAPFARTPRKPAELRRNTHFLPQFLQASSQMEFSRPTIPSADYHDQNLLDPAEPRLLLLPPAARAHFT